MPENKTDLDYSNQLSEREFKVRIIERLGKIEQKLNN
jgi:hypothetical protein